MVPVICLKWITLIDTVNIAFCICLQTMKYELNSFMVLLSYLHLPNVKNIPTHTQFYFSIVLFCEYIIKSPINRFLFSQTCLPYLVCMTLCIYGILCIIRHNRISWAQQPNWKFPGSCPATTNLAPGRTSKRLVVKHYNNHSYYVILQ